MQLDAFTAKELDGGQANRIRTSRRSGRKHPMWPIVRWRRGDQFRPMQFVPMSVQFELRGTVELPDDDEMRESLDVGEPRLKFRQNLEHTIGLVFSAQPLGNFTYVLVRATHKSNWLRSEHTCAMPPCPNTNARRDAKTHTSWRGAPSKLRLGGGFDVHPSQT